MKRSERHNELLSIRAMAKALMEKADRLIEKEQRPVSTGGCKKSLKEIIGKTLAHRAKIRRRPPLHLNRKKEIV